MQTLRLPFLETVMMCMIATPRRPYGLGEGWSTSPTPHRPDLALGLCHLAHGASHGSENLVARKHWHCSSAFKFPDQREPHKLDSAVLCAASGMQRSARPDPGLQDPRARSQPWRLSRDGLDPSPGSVWRHGRAQFMHSGTNLSLVCAG